MPFYTLLRPVPEVWSEKADFREQLQNTRSLIGAFGPLKCAIAAVPQSPAGSNRGLERANGVNKVVGVPFTPGLSATPKEAWFSFVCSGGSRGKFGVCSVPHKDGSRGKFVLVLCGSPSGAGLGEVLVCCSLASTDLGVGKATITGGKHWVCHLQRYSLVVPVTAVKATPRFENWGKVAAWLANVFTVPSDARQLRFSAKFKVGYAALCKSADGLQMHNFYTNSNLTSMLGKTPEAPRSARAP